MAMADNVTLNAGSGGETLSTDEVSVYSTTAHVQRVKLGHGADGTYTADVNVASPLPVNAYLASSTMQDGTTQLTPKFVAISAFAADAALVAAVTSKKIRVLALFMSASADGSAKFWSDTKTTGTVLTGDFLLDAGTASNPFVLPFNPVGWFETVAGEALYLDMTTATLNGCLVYVEV
jgi:hypothetical protein